MRNRAPWPGIRDRLRGRKLGSAKKRSGARQLLEIRDRTADVNVSEANRAANHAITLIEWSQEQVTVERETGVRILVDSQPDSVQ